MEKDDLFPSLEDLQPTELLIDYQDEDISILDNVKDFAHLKDTKIPKHVVVLGIKGTMTLSVDNRHLSLSSNELLMCPERAYITDVKMTSGFECKICTFTDRILQDCLHNNVNLWNNAVYIRKINHITLQPESVDFIQHLCEALRFLINDHNRPYKKEKIQALIGVLLLSLCSLLYEEMSENSIPIGDISRKEIIFHDFLRRISKEGNKMRSVDEYAEQMHISSRYLANVCKAISGKTASSWIEDFVMEEIRRYLRTSNMSIKEIAAVLSFPNLSLLGKYVKRKTGLSPRELRKTLRQ
ncbi:MAG: helix-turn-helix domain-containing protein [Prevotellaceae bacterium]|nr:helix-turn-helix domain-containing protein [Prevotellaceae bacterium]